MNKKNVWTLTAIALIIIALITTIVIVSLNNGNNGGGTSVSNKEEEYLDNKESIDLGGNDNVIVNEDGTTVNKSEDIKKDKQVAGLVISNIQVKYVGKQTEISGTIKNNTSSEINAGDVKVLIKDSANKTFREIEVYIGKVKANSSKPLSVTTQADISNMKNIEFSK